MNQQTAATKSMKRKCYHDIISVEYNCSLRFTNIKMKDVVNEGLILKKRQINEIKNNSLLWVMSPLTILASAGSKAPVLMT